MASTQTRQDSSPSSLSFILNPSSRKRSVGDIQESDDENRQAKKPRIKTEPLLCDSDALVKSRDKKRRRKKKKKRQPVVVAVPSTNVVTPISPNASSSSAQEVVSPINSGKGKRKATFASPPPSDSPPRPELANGEPESPTTKIARLTSELQVQTLLLQSHKTLISSLTPSLICQVCLDLLQKPHALSPCGHIACEACLVRWFTSPPPGENEENLFVPLTSASRRIKTCPHCRAAITQRPVEMWGIKSMVNALVKSGLGSGDVIPPQATETEDATADPWKDIFPLRLRRLPAGTFDLHQAIFGRLSPTPPPFLPALQNLNGRPQDETGIPDAEDGVYRCVDCLHELWHGVCTGCDRVYHGNPEYTDIYLSSDDEDEDYSSGIEWIGVDPGRADGDDEDDHLPFFELSAPNLSMPSLMPLIPENDNDDDASSDEEYEGSFIDDEGGAVIWPWLVGSPQARDHSDLDSEGDEVRRRVRGRRPAAVISDDDNEDGGVRRGNMRRRRVVSSDDEAPGSDVVIVDDSRSGLQHSGNNDNSATGSESRTLYSDEAEDDFSVPGPSRRLGRLFDAETEDEEGSSSTPRRRSGYVSQEEVDEVPPAVQARILGRRARWTQM